MATIPRWSRHANIQLVDDPQLAEVLSPHAVERHCRQATSSSRSLRTTPGQTKTQAVQPLDETTPTVPSTRRPTMPLASCHSWLSPVSSPRFP